MAKTEPLGVVVCICAHMQLEELARASVRQENKQSFDCGIDVRQHIFVLGRT